MQSKLNCDWWDGTGQNRTDLLLLMAPWEKKGEMKEGETFFVGSSLHPLVLLSVRPLLLLPRWGFVSVKGATDLVHWLLG